MSIVPMLIQIYHFGSFVYFVKKNLVLKLFKSNKLEFIPSLIYTYSILQ